MAQKSSLLIDIGVEETKAFDLSSVLVPHALKSVYGWGDGAVANQANRVWSDKRTLGPSASEDLDLAGAALLDMFGAAVVFARVRALIVRAPLANTNNVIVGGVASGLATILAPAATGTLIVRPGGVFLAAAPDATAYVVTATTADLLHIANSAGGTSVDYEIVIIGSAT